MLQEKLRSDGRKTFVTGEWDQATAREVRDYQKAHGLAPTGQLDTSLLSALDMGEGTAAAANKYRREHGLEGTAGIETGVIDGAWDEDTKQGVKEFQRKHDLEPTGTLTLPTLAASGIDVKHDARHTVAND